MFVKYSYSRTLSVSFVRVVIYTNGAYASQWTANHRQQHTSQNISEMRLNGMRPNEQRLSGQRPNGQRPNGQRLKGRGQRERGLRNAAKRNGITSTCIAIKSPLWEFPPLLRKVHTCRRIPAILVNRRHARHCGNCSLRNILLQSYICRLRFTTTRQMPDAQRPLYGCLRPAPIGPIKRLLLWPSRCRDDVLTT